MQFRRVFFSSALYKEELVNNGFQSLKTKEN